MHRAEMSSLCGLGCLIAAHVGCSDRAKPNYEQCIHLQSVGNLKEAIDACYEAIAIAPGSASAKAALTKLAEIRPAFAKHEAAALVMSTAPTPTTPRSSESTAGDPSKSLCAAVDLERFLYCDRTMEAEAVGKPTEMHACDMSLERVASLLRHMPSTTKQKTRAEMGVELEEQASSLGTILSTVKDRAAVPGEEPAKISFIADSQRVIAAFKKWATLMRDYDGSSGGIASEATKTEKLVHDLRFNNVSRLAECFRQEDRAAGSPPGTGTNDNGGTDAKHPVLPASDDGFVDTRGGGGWSDRCFTNIKAKNWGWAKAECDKAMTMNPAPPQPLASLFYNEGLIANQSGAVQDARHDFVASLVLRENPAVRASLNSLPPGAAPSPNAPCSEVIGAAAAQRLVEQCRQVTPASPPQDCNPHASCDRPIGHIKYMCSFLSGEGSGTMPLPAFCSDYGPGRVTNAPAEQKLLEAQKQAAETRKNISSVQSRPTTGGAKPCNCAADDPLCSCIPGSVHGRPTMGGTKPTKPCNCPADDPLCSCIP